MTVDEHIDPALASLAAVSIRELEATEDVLASRRHPRHPLHQFAGVFRDVAIARELGKDPHLARFHVGQNVRDEWLVEKLEGAEAPLFGGTSVRRRWRITDVPERISEGPPL